MNIIYSLVLLFSLSFLPTYSIEISQSQSLDVPNSGFYPFSQSGSDELKELIPSNPRVSILITDFSGKPFFIAPAADNREIGPKQKIKGNGVYILNFKKGSKKTLLGLSLVPKGTSTMITIAVDPFAKGTCPNPVNCQDDCGVNLGKCCEKNASGNVGKICKQVGTSSCGCANR